MTPLYLSIVIPAYNEAGRLGRTLERIRQYASKAAQSYEVVVVDDGSRDGTADLVRALTDPRPLTLRLLVNPANRGKGYSVREGVLAASGDPILMSDADLSTPIEELEKLQPWLSRGYDVVIGSRDLPDSRLDPPQRWMRRLMARAFRTIRRRLLLPQILDTQCGFKLFTRSAARDLFSRLTVSGWLFDCEVLALAQRLGYRTKEVGVVWQHHPDSRVRPLREAISAVPVLMCIRRRVGRVRPGPLFSRSPG